MAFIEIAIVVVVIALINNTFALILNTQICNTIVVKSANWIEWDVASFDEA